MGSESTARRASGLALVVLAFSACVTRPSADDSRARRPTVVVDGSALPVADEPQPTFAARVAQVAALRSEPGLERLAALFPDEVLAACRAASNPAPSDPLRIAYERAVGDEQATSDLLAIAALGDDASTLERAFAQARATGRRHLALELGLRLAEQRRAGGNDGDGAAAAWREAIVAAGGVASARLLERCVDLAPEGAPWPAGA